MKWELRVLSAITGAMVALYGFLALELARVGVDAFMQKLVGGWW